MGGAGEKPSWMRRKLLVDEHFQLRFLLFCGGVALAACAAFYGASSYFFSRYTTFAIEAGLRPSDPFFRVLYNMENMLTYIFAYTSGGVIVVTAIGGLIFSNRVAGPLYRFRSHCEGSTKNTTADDVSFRKDDYFHEVATAYNFQMKMLRENYGVPGSGKKGTDPNLSHSAPAEPVLKKTG